MKKPTIAVIFGSRSAEHDVSIITAINAIIKPLELTKKYDVLPVYITKDGAWYAGDKLKDIALYSSGRISEFLAKSKPVSVQFDGGMTLVWQGLRGNSQKIDIVFPATHGTFGEDGALMGLLEMANVPYVGCSLPSSVLAMDKVLSKQIADMNGVPVSKYISVISSKFSGNPTETVSQIEKSLKYPLFVKPAHLGSSIAITKVSDATELNNAMELAAHYDEKLIVEEAVPNLVEVTVPVMGNDELTVASTEEPIQGEAFFDFETKYMGQGKGKGGTKTSGSKQGAQGYSHIPARVSSDMEKSCIDTAKAVYRSLGCTGTARIDLLIDSKAGKIYFNEVNPLPGSLYAHNWRSKGVSNISLVERLVELALERYERNRQYQTVFETNFLKQF